jgi:prepilin-type N-terminal cleavage/methylation domain-containing protein
MKKTSFTLIELLIVIVIIGIVATLAVPQYQAMKEKAIAVEAINRLDLAMKEVLLYFIEKNGIIDESWVYITDKVLSWKTEYWAYGWSCKTAGPILPNHITITAGRRNGPYVGTYISRRWCYEDNRYEWLGTHPAVPKN